MTYYYHCSYDERNDEFFAMVDDGTRSGDTIFQIDSTMEMCAYIRNGQMEHIDDTDGLEEHLKHLGVLQADDCLLFREKMLW